MAAPWLSLEHVSRVWRVASDMGMSPWCEFESAEGILEAVAGPSAMAKKTVGQLEALYGGLHAVEKGMRALLMLYPTGFGKSMPLFTLARLIDQVYPRTDDGSRTKTILVSPLIA